MTQSEDPVVIVGAGPAGAVTAALLARRRLQVTLLDRARFPRDKPCGEGIMPQGVDILRELGVLPALEDRGARRFHGIHLRSPDGTWARADFAEGHGLVVRRTVLDETLARHVGVLPGVTLREGVDVTGVLREGSRVRGVVAGGEPLRAAVVVAADGPRSSFHEGCALRKRWRRPRRYGVVGHVAPPPDRPLYVEVHFHAWGEAYVAPPTSDGALVVLLMGEREAARFEGDPRPAYLERVRTLEGFGPTAEPTTSVSRVGPLGFEVAPIVLPGLLLVGDSAGFLDPITGEGMTLAMKSARAAADVIAAALQRGDASREALRPYEARRAAALDDLAALTLLMLRLARHPALVRRAVSRLRKQPPLFEKLLGVVTGRRRYAEISWAEKLGLVLGA